MRSRLCYSAVLLAVALGALAFRLPQLKQRPMHTDEAVHAEKFKMLLEQGQYQYNPLDYHGPTLNYFTLPVAWLGSVKTLTQTTEITLRLVPVIFGVGVVLLFAGLRDALGRWGAWFAAIGMAISPALVFYNRYYIQESLLVFFTFLVFVAGWQYLRTRKLYWALVAGASVGFMHATKETCIIAYGSFFAALIVMAFWYKRTTRNAPTIRSFVNQKHLAMAIGTAMLISVLFFTSFFQNPRGLVDSILTYGNCFDKVGDPGVHRHPWYYYLQMLTYIQYYDGPRWSEGLIVALALLGLIFACFRKSTDGSIWFVRLVGVYTVVMVTIYSIIPYKTPWCMMGFLHGMILLAGWAAVQCIRSIPKISGKIIVCLLLAAGGGHLGWQAWRAGFQYYDDSLNPYVYAHTVSDIYKLVDRVRQLSHSHQAGRNMPLEIICSGSDYWPLPWYFRDFPILACRDQVDPHSPLAPVTIVSPDRQSDVIDKIYKQTPVEDRRLYVDDFYPNEIWLRPNVPLKLFVTQDLWERQAQRRQQSSLDQGIQSR